METTNKGLQTFKTLIQVLALTVPAPVLVVLLNNHHYPTWVQLLLLIPIIVTFLAAFTGVLLLSGLVIALIFKTENYSTTAWQAAKLPLILIKRNE